MQRAAMLLAVALAAVLALVPGTARAGGWAVAPIDPLPPVEAGAPLTVGFTVLQHGRTPFDVADFPGATVGLGVSVDGAQRFVEATPTGEPGRYTATVDVPADAAEIGLRVEMPTGLFMDEQWTTLPVDSGAASGSWLPTWTVPLFGIGAVACAAALVGRLRRRPAAVTAPA